MNAKIKTLVATAFITTLLFMTSCKDKPQHNHENTNEQTESVKKQGKEYTSTYVCPMHCKGSGSEHEGTCPKCNMTYVMNENHKKKEHEH